MKQDIIVWLFGICFFGGFTCLILAACVDDVKFRKCSQMGIAIGFILASLIALFFKSAIK